MMATTQSRTEERVLNCSRYYIYEKKKLKPWEPDPDLRNIIMIKYFAEVYTYRTKFKLDKKLKRPTIKSMRVQIRIFMSAWQCKTNLTIPIEVHDSICPISIPQRSPILRYRLSLTKIVYPN
jgi:hypothetical protein